MRSTGSGFCAEQVWGADRSCPCYHNLCPPKRRLCGLLVCLGAHHATPERRKSSRLEFALGPIRTKDTKPEWPEGIAKNPKVADQRIDRSCAEINDCADHGSLAKHFPNGTLAGCAKRSCAKEDRGECTLGTQFSFLAHGGLPSTAVAIAYALVQEKRRNDLTPNAKSGRTLISAHAVKSAFTLCACIALCTVDTLLCRGGIRLV